MQSIQVVKGSLAHQAKQNNQSVAESFVSADVVVLVDTSASMSECDSRDGLSRYDAACQELIKLQNTLAGRIAVISFSSSQVFCPNGIPQNLYAGTMLAEALQFAKMADIAPMRFIVISDGYPDNPVTALAIASQFVSRIDTIHVGAENDKAGIYFLQKLAMLQHGQSTRAGQANDLAKVAERLLSSGR